MSTKNLKESRIRRPRFKQISRLISFVLLMCNFGLTIFAQGTGFSSMKIIFMDDSYTILPLFDTTEIELLNDRYYFNINDTETYVYLLEEIKGVTYLSSSEDSIKYIEADDNSKISFDGDKLLIQGLSTFVIFDINGNIKVPVMTIDSPLSICVSDFQAGLYIVLVDGKSFKFMKK